MHRTTSGVLSSAQAVLIAILLQCAPAAAATFRASTTGTHPVRISNEASWNRSCQTQGGPDYRFSRQPSNGTISMQPEEKTIRSCDAGGCECMGHRVTGTSIYYTANPGFHGADEFDFAATFPNGKTLSHQAYVTVH